MEEERVLTAVSHSTYRMFAKRYNIRLMDNVDGKYKYRPSSELKKDIWDYEEEHSKNPHFPTDGMYF